MGLWSGGGGGKDDDSAVVEDEIHKAIRAADDFKAVSAGKFMLAIGAVNIIKVHYSSSKFFRFGIVC